MATKRVVIIKNGDRQEIQLPKDMEFEGIDELEISKIGEIITLRPTKPDWISFKNTEKASPDFMSEREDILEKRGL